MRFSFFWAFVLICSAGQGQTGSGPAFEVASIRPSEPLSPSLAEGMAQLARGGSRIVGDQVSLSRVTLRDLIARAYRVEGFRVSGPDWIDSAQFDVIAKMPKSSSPDQVPEMLQELLAARFALKAHPTTRVFQAYILTMDGGNAKAVPLPQDYATARQANTIPMSMNGFVRSLSQALERPVVNQTGSDGTYMFPRTFFSGLSNRSMWLRVGKNPAIEQSVTVPSEGEITKGVSAAGFHIELRKTDLKIVVVDNLNKTPTGN